MAKKRFKAKKAELSKREKYQAKTGYEPGLAGMRGRFYEFKGNPTFTDPAIIGKIQSEFIKAASDPMRASVTWITRSEGMGKDKKLMSTIPARDTPSHVAPQGAIGGKFGETYRIGHKGKPVDVYVPNPKAAATAYYDKKAKGGIYSDPTKMKPRADLGSIITHAADSYNRNLLAQITDSYEGYTGNPASMIKEEYEQRKIKTQAFTVDGSRINYYKKQGYSNKDAYKLAKRAVDKEISDLIGRTPNSKTVAITRKGEFEGKHEREARILYEQMGKARALSGVKSFLPGIGETKTLASDILIDEYIDEVNKVNRETGKALYSDEFKAGARLFLENKEADWIYQTFESATDHPVQLTEDRLQDMRTWGAGSVITSSDHTIPKYKEIPGKSGTTYVGSTLVHAQTISGPELPENIQLQSTVASGDYGFHVDYSAEGFSEDYKPPTPITTSGDEYPASTDPAVTKTKTYDASGLHSRQGGYSEQVAVMKESELISGSRILPIPGSIVTSSFRNVTQLGGETDEVKSLIYGDFDDDIAGEQVIDTQKAEEPDVNVKGSAAKGSGFAIDNLEWDQLTSIKMSEDMMSIEEAGKYWGTEGVYSRGVNEGLSPETRKSMQGASLITSAFAGMEGGTLDEGKVLDIAEQRAIIQGNIASINQAANQLQWVSQEGDVDPNLKITGKKDPGGEYKPTRQEILRKEIWDNTPDEIKTEKKAGYPGIRNQKIKEYNARKLAGTNDKFFADMAQRNRKNSLITAPIQGAATNRVNPAEAILNPNANKKPVQNPPATPTVKRDKLIVGDIWTQKGYTIVSTNLGGVHGRGLAKQAADQGLIGPGHKSFDTSPVILSKGDPKFDSGVITLAVKGNAPETAKIPGKAFSESTTAGNVALMQSEVNKLINYARKNPTKRFNLPMIGLGFGEGDPNVIKPILAKAAQEPNIYLISKDDKTVAKYKSSFAPGVRSDSTSRKTIAPKPESDIVLKKSSILTKEAGKPTFTTKEAKVDKALKTGKNLLKGPGSTTLNALTAFSLISPFIGAFGSVVQEQKREEKRRAAFPLYPPKKKSLLTRFSEMKNEDYYQALSHRFFPEELYGDQGYSSLKKVKEFRRKGGLHWNDPI